MVDAASPEFRPLQTPNYSSVENVATYVRNGSLSIQDALSTVCTFSIQKQITHSQNKTQIYGDLNQLVTALRDRWESTKAIKGQRLQFTEGLHADFNRAFNALALCLPKRINSSDEIVSLVNNLEGLITSQKEFLDPMVGQNNLLLPKLGALDPEFGQEYANRIKWHKRAGETAKEKWQRRKEVPFGRQPRLMSPGAYDQVWTREASENGMVEYFRYDFKHLFADGTEGVDKFMFWLINRHPMPVVVDLQSSPEALRTLVGLFKYQRRIKGLAVSLTNTNPHPDFDTTWGISHIPADLSLGKTWRKIDDWRGDDKVHMLTARGLGGLHFIPTRTAYGQAAIGRIWNMLEPDGGTAFLQIPPEPMLKQRGIPVTEWVEALKTGGYNFAYLPEYISFQDGFASHGVTQEGEQIIGYGLLRLTRDTNPAHLHLPTIPTSVPSH